MPKDQGIRDYLDAGTLTLFAGQLKDGLDDVLSVAVYGADGRRAWCGPGGDDARHWPDDGFVHNVFASDAGCVELASGRFAHAFPLGRPGEEQLGQLLVQTRGRQLEAEHARRIVKPILDCLHKQLDISIELTASRELSARERENAKLLVRLDDLCAQGASDGALDEALGAVAVHFGAQLAVLWGEDPAVAAGMRPTAPLSARTLSRIGPIFRRLHAAARKRRRVLLADAPSALARVAGSDTDTARVLSSPVLNERDEVTGGFALVGGETLRDDEVRCARVVASKLAVLLQVAATEAVAPLTRHDLLAIIDRQLREAPAGDSALLLVDIDKLHVVNEMHGHFAGDAAIRHVLAQAADAGGTGAIACDLQGGVLALYLPAADEARALATGDLLRERLLRQPVAFEQRRIPVEVSVGIALLPTVARDAATALNTAEVAARSAKARGGDQCVVFHDLDASVLRRREDLDQVGLLQAALIDNRFELFAQPIVPLGDLDSRPRYEILLRMVDGEGRMLSPERFLSAAERYQMMASIDRWVVRTATDALSQRENQLELNLASFSINVSTQSMMDEAFPGFVESSIRNSGIAPDTFCFEITETSVMRNLERAQDLLQRFRRLGCRIALDDFGTGQCSFAYLKDLPVQYVKIDGVFVRDILENPLSEAIVESVARIARVIDAQTVAEFVENEQIVERLRRAGIDFAQGYQVGRPQPLAEVLTAFDEPLIATAALESAVG